MTIQEALEKNDMSIYKLSKKSSIPYATLNDIINGKTQLEKCSAETIYKISKALNISMESILAPCFEERSNFDNFKSTICHRLKEMGDIDFVIDTLKSQNIRKYFKRKWYLESFYLLAMLDYISRENNIPLCNDYDDIRKCKLEKTVYPASLIAMSVACKKNDVLKRAESMAIPEFKRFNIIESEVRNVA